MQKDKYFKEPNLFFKTLRFFNLLEPRKTVLSLSKVFFYISTFVLLWVVFNRPDDLNAVLATTGTNILATVNYMHRRNTQPDTETPAAPDATNKPDDKPTVGDGA